MTSQKHLKQLVRDRMARTGEAYTTARRHVLAKAARDSAPELPTGLLPGYDRFGGGQHRLSTLLAHLLRQAGHVAPHPGRPYTQAMLAGLAGGNGLLYPGVEYQGFPPMMRIVAPRP